MREKIVQSIFFKLILFFAVILFISFAAILFYSNHYLNQRAKSSLELESISAINIMHNYLSEKYNISKDAIGSIYKISYYDTITDYMSSDSDDIQKRAKFISTMDEFLQFYFSSDNDIIYMAMESYKDGELYALYQNPFEKSIRLNEALQARIDLYREALPDYGFIILPAYTSEISPYSGSLISMLCTVKNVGMTKDLGCVYIDYSLNSMESELSHFFSSYPDSALYIIASDGSVLYDSTRSLTGESRMDFDPLKIAQGDESQSFDDVYYTKTVYNSDMDLYFMSVQPVCGIYSNLRAQKLFIYISLTLLIVISLFSVILFSKQYFRRISTICSAIHKIRSGDLKIQLPVSSKSDELSLISGNLNDMCTMLNDYIQKVYISQINAQANELLYKDAELKQKAAELYALQTQINPHFLYNTLESIRMRALSSGNRDVAQMVYLLSTLFKQSLKGGFITSISEELDTCRLYLELTAFRFPQNFHVQINVAENIRECAIIRHIMQPIIENSIQHGLNPNASDNSIEIAIYREETDILIQVTDNGKGIPPDRLSLLRQQLSVQTSHRTDRIGLSNVHQRIVVLFGTKYGISLDSLPGKATTTTIRIPYMTVKEMENYVQRFNRR